MFTEAMPATPDHVFVFRIGNLGDTLVALPAIHRIAQLHRGARFTLITNAPARASMVTAWDVLQHTGLFENAIFYHRRSPQQLLHLALECRRSTNPVLYYLTPSRTIRQVQRDRVFFRVACGFRRIEALAPSPLAGRRDAEGELEIFPRECDRLLQSVAGQGPLVQAPPFLSPPEAATRHARQLLAPLGDRPIVAFGPGSKMPAKKWFLDRFVGLVQKLVDHYPDVGVAIFGGAEDHDDGETLVAAAGAERAVNLAGAANIIESAAALSMCQVYVGNDTGTMHLAAIMGVPCVAIFTSRANRNIWDPWGDSHAVLRHDLPCSGCMLERCVTQRMRCLDLIGVDDVWAEIVPRLGQGRGPRHHERRLSVIA